MTRAAILICALVLAAAPAARAGDTAFVDVEVRDTCFVGEAVRVRVRVGLDAEYFETNVIQAFQQELDVPVHLQAPWLRELPGAAPVALPPDDAPRVTCALNDDVAHAARVADEERDGRRFAVYAFERGYRFEEPGTYELSAARLQYSYATRFQEDFVNGRVALDPETASVVGAPLTITVHPLPEEGRPAAFTGGVGRFTVHATAERGQLLEGETMKLVLTIEGEGNLATLDAPRLDELGGFHVYGALDDKGATVRTITYDVSPEVAALTEIPAISFAYFDPAPPAGYRTVRTEPIPIKVHAKQPWLGDPDGPPDVALPGAGGAFGAYLGLGAIAPLLLVVVLAALLALVLYFRRRNRLAAAARATAASPAAAFRARADLDLTDALVHYLAAHLDCPPATVIDPHLVARLTAAGAPHDLAARTAKLLEDLVGARYGGGVPAGSVDAAHALVDDLERRPRQSP